MKKVSGYALAIAVLSAISTTPAQAVSLVQDTTNDEQITATNTTNEEFNLEGSILQEAQSEIAEIDRASTVTEVTNDGTNFYIYRSSNSSDVPPELFAGSYNDRQTTPRRRKVPEPSLAIGLIAAACLAAVRLRHN
ncbi:hypothetical protein [Iningainema tapete]|uniref:PEP-CTERM sorting domain-containing protein n=1 Tax=Iningainema tapete BLCC-T55 TaxID=2748662 RepID=A0A8J6XIB2_9CYAN|nr:hypothetical protein [Iningainema tapete]MBD2771231.1 hypothetical protein [Iningainema tapete BLCC-T55]